LWVQKIDEKILVGDSLGEINAEKKMSFGQKKKLKLIVVGWKEVVRL
jgi:hypothetical protein